MTDSTAMTNPLLAHTDVEKAASAWIERRDLGDWNAQAQGELDTWLNEDIAHRVAFWRLEAAWDRTERLAALRPSDLRAAARPDIISNPRNTFKFVAAFGMLAAICGAALIYFSAPDYQTFATTIGGREVLTLRDGSIIELNASTVIHLADNAHGRSVSLERGEAFFNIRHDAAHPFTVTAGRQRITDLGTQFSVRADLGKVQVALIEGRAEVAPIAGGRSTVLLPGDVAVATAVSFSLQKRPMRALSDALGWRRGQLIFYHTTLADAVSELNRYNRQQITIADKHLARLVINGSFPTNGIDSFTQAAEQVFGLHITHHGEEIVISR